MADRTAAETCESLLAAGLIARRDLTRARRWVRACAAEFAASDLVWIDALLQHGAISTHQARVARTGQIDRLVVGPWLLERQLARRPWSAAYRARLRGTTIRIRLVAAAASSSLLDAPWPADRREPALLSTDILEQALADYLARVRAIASPALVVPSAGRVESQRIWLESPLLAAEPLAVRLARHGRVTGDVALAWARQMAHALAELESRAMSHGDVAAESVLVDATGHVYLIEPALPELARAGDSATEPTDDRCAVARLWWQLVTGGGAGAAARMGRQKADFQEAGRWRSDDAAVPPQLARLLPAMLSDEPSARPTWAEIVEQLAPQPCSVALSGFPGARRVARVPPPERWHPLVPPRVVQPNWGGLFGTVALAVSACVLVAAYLAAPGGAGPAQPATAEGVGAMASSIATASGTSTPPRGAESMASVSVASSIEGERETAAARAPPAAAERAAPSAVPGAAPAVAWTGSTAGNRVTPAVGQSDPASRVAVVPASTFEPLASHPANDRQWRAAGRVLDAGTLDWSMLALEPGDTVCPPGEQRLLVRVPRAGVHVDAPNVRFERLDFVAESDHLAEPVAVDRPWPLLVVRSSGMELVDCTLQASPAVGSVVGVTWLCSASAAHQELLPSASLAMSRCALRGLLAGIDIAVEGATRLDSEHVLHLGPGPFVRLDRPPRADEPMLLAVRDSTLRAASGLLAVSYAEPPGSLGRLALRVDRSLLAPAVQGAVVQVVGRTNPQPVLRAIEWSGSATLLSETGQLAQWWAPDRQWHALPSDAVRTAGLVRGTFVFQSEQQRRTADSRLVRWSAPLEGEKAPGMGLAVPEFLPFWR